MNMTCAPPPSWPLLLRNRQVRFLVWCLFLPGLFVSCSETWQLKFDVITAADNNPFEDIHTLEVTLSGITRTVQCSDSGCPFDVKFKLQEGETGRLVLKGYNADNLMVAAGFSPRFTAVDAAVRLGVHLGRLQSAGVVDTFFEAPPEHASVAPLHAPGPRDLSTNVGTLLFGGKNLEGLPSDEVWYYDPYILALIPQPPLSLPLSGAGIMELGNGNFLLYGGQTENNRISGTMLYYTTSSVQAPGSHVITLPPDQAPVPAAFVRTVEIGPFDSLFDSSTNEYLLTAFLLLSGETEDQSPAPITWVFVYYSIQTSTTTIRTSRSELTLPAGVSAMATRLHDTAYRIIIPESRLFLTATVETGPLGLTPLLVTEDMPELPERSGWHLVPAGDERMLAIAGRDSEGHCVAEWFDVHMRAKTVTPLPGGPQRCDGRFFQVGKLLVAVGGVNMEDLSIQSACWEMNATETGISLGERLDITGAISRKHPQVFMLPSGNLAAYGGRHPDTNELAVALELFTFDPRISMVPSP